MTKTAERWWCKGAEQPGDHLYTKCRKWRRERRVFEREFKELGIGWQSRPERRWVANILGNERAIQPILEYLITTEVRSREGRAGRAAERDERVSGPRRGGIT